MGCIYCLGSSAAPASLVAWHPRLLRYIPSRIRFIQLGRSARHADRAVVPECGARSAVPALQALPSGVMLKISPSPGYFASTWQRGSFKTTLCHNLWWTGHCAVNITYFFSGQRPDESHCNCVPEQLATNHIVDVGCLAARTCAVPRGTPMCTTERPHRRNRECHPNPPGISTSAVTLVGLVTRVRHRECSKERLDHLLGWVRHEVAG